MISRISTSRKNISLNVFMIVAAILLTIISSRSSFAQPAGAKTNYDQLREYMVTEDLAGQGIKNERVLKSFRSTLRHEFVSIEHRKNAYFDMAMPIGDSQTISAPFVVAYMTEQLDPQPEDKVLEIGTGSGFQAAILSPLVKEVYSIEIVERLGAQARKTLDRLKYKNIHTKIGDGFQGWAEHAPFDKIIVTCSPEKVPQPLVDQLKEGGRMIVPVGERYQQVLYLMQKKDGKLEQAILRPTCFVPMTGKAESTRAVLPDPANPKVNNSSFEEIAGDSKEPMAWYYQRQMEIISNETAPAGKNFIRFKNETLGREARMMQGMGLDGRKVHAIEVSAMVRGKNISNGNESQIMPVVLVIYFDEKRNVLTLQKNWLGPFAGTFDWKKESKKFVVPSAAREVIVNIGLMGATGQIDFDDVELKAIDAIQIKK